MTSRSLPIRTGIIPRARTHGMHPVPAGITSNARNATIRWERMNEREQALRKIKKNKNETDVYRVEVKRVVTLLV